MTDQPIVLPALEGRWPARFDRFGAALEAIFTGMDQAYARAAAAYPFQCQGCDDNCCRSRFYHHTLLEVLQLARGYRRLARAERRLVRRLAREALAAPEGARPMCPFSLEERCRIYPFRPMICRLHGIPSELALPGRAPLRSPGCAAFDARCGTRPYQPLDRSPHYAALARLEAQCRAAVSFGARLRLTIAEIVCAWPPEGDLAAAGDEREATP
jgi:Fe-S-cluster containining protein